MDAFKIIGGKPLRGEVTISGAKNAALPILMATLLSETPITISNVPRLNDIETTLKLLTQLGAKAQWVGDNEILVDASKIAHCRASYDLVKTMRASILVLGPLLARFGHAEVSLPGGCAIGARPVNLHIQGLKLMGLILMLIMVISMLAILDVCLVQLFLWIPSVLLVPKI